MLRFDRNKLPGSFSGRLGVGLVGFRLLFTPKT
jgi:hypothetical protein